MQDILSWQLIKAGDTGRSQKSSTSESWYSDDDGTSSDSLVVEGFSGVAFSTWLMDYGKEIIC